MVAHVASQIFCQMFDNHFMTLLTLLTPDFHIKVYISFKVREKLFLSSSSFPPSSQLAF